MALENLRYNQDFAAAQALPKPDPNTFMKWLFTSGILSEWQKDIIKAAMSDPAQANAIAQQSGADTGSPASAQPANVTGTQPVQSAQSVAQPAQPNVTKPV